MTPYRLIIVTAVGDGRYKLQRFIVLAHSAKDATLIVGFRPEGPYRVFVQAQVREGIIAGLVDAPASFCDMDRLMYMLMNESHDEPFRLMEVSSPELPFRLTGVKELDVVPEAVKIKSDISIVDIDRMHYLDFEGVRLDLVSMFVDRERNLYPNFYYAMANSGLRPTGIDYRELHFGYSSKGIEDAGSLKMDFIVQLSADTQEIADELSAKVIAAIDAHPLGRHVLSVQKCLDPSETVLESLVFRTDLDTMLPIYG